MDFVRNYYLRELNYAGNIFFFFHCFCGNLNPLNFNFVNFIENFEKCLGKLKEICPKTLLMYSLLKKGTENDILA